MIKIGLYCFVLKLVFISVWCKGGKGLWRGEGVVEGGREEGFVKCNKSCLYVCCKKENNPPPRPYQILKSPACLGLRKEIFLFLPFFSIFQVYYF